MRPIFYQSNPHEPESSLRTDERLHSVHADHKGLSMIVLDIELVVLVLGVALVLNKSARFAWSYFRLGQPAKGRKKDRSRESSVSTASGPRGTFPRNLPPPTYGTGVFAKVVHERLSGSAAEDELLPFLVEHTPSFSLANTVHAIVKCGTLKVQPGPAWDGLVAKVAGDVPRLKVRGLAHVLWGLARVEPGCEREQVLDDLVKALSTKWAELKGSDLLSAVWAVAELRGDTTQAGPAFRRVQTVLSCAGKALQASLPQFTAEELASLLETLASPKLLPPPGESAPTAPLVVAACTTLLVLSKKPKVKPVRGKRDASALALPDIVKAVASVASLVRTGAIGLDREPGELLRSLALRLAEVPTAKGTQFRSAVQTIAKLRVEDVGVGVFDKLARSAVLLGFASLPRKQLVQLALCLGPVAATHTLECGSEFFLELAQQLNALEGLGADDAAVRAAFKQVGYASMLRALA